MGIYTTKIGRSSLGGKLGATGRFEADGADELTGGNEVFGVSARKIRSDHLVKIGLERLKVGGFAVTAGKFNDFPHEPTRLEVPLNHDSVCVLQEATPFHHSNHDNPG